MYYNKVEICGVNTSQLKVLTDEEKHTLLLRSKDGDEEARRELINGNLRLVLSVIQKFAGRILRSPSTDVLYVCDTFQFDDYSRYDAPLFDAAAKQKVRDTKFQEDCRKAFMAGSKLVKP